MPVEHEQRLEVLLLQVSLEHVPVVINLLHLLLQLLLGRVVEVAVVVALGLGLLGVRLVLGLLRFAFPEKGRKK